MNMVERVGLLKLRLPRAAQPHGDEGRQRRDPAHRRRPDFDLATIPDDDARTYEMLGRGETLGVFQLESDGMKRVCVELKPSALDDIIALVALYRPGPMDWIPRLHRVQTRPQDAQIPASQTRADPERHLRHRVLSRAGDADRARPGRLHDGPGRRTAQGHGEEAERPDPDYRKQFIDGCATSNGIDAKLAEDIFAFIEPFAGYGFNKSHAAAYGWISYQTGYLKANYPLQYFAALMSSVRDKTDKLVEYIEEAKKMGIAVLPPDVNESLVDFAVVGVADPLRPRGRQGHRRGRRRRDPGGARTRRQVHRSVRSRPNASRRKPPTGKSTRR